MGLAGSGIKLRRSLAGLCNLNDLCFYCWLPRVLPFAFFRRLVLGLGAGLACGHYLFGLLGCLHPGVVIYPNPLPAIVLAVAICWPASLLLLLMLQPWVIYCLLLLLGFLFLEAPRCILAALLQYFSRLYG